MVNSYFVVYRALSFVLMLPCLYNSSTLTPTEVGLSSSVLLSQILSIIIVTTVLKLFLPLCQQTPLHMVVRQGQMHTVECLVDQRADINIKDNDGVSKGGRLVQNLGYIPIHPKKYPVFMVHN